MCVIKVKARNVAILLLFVTLSSVILVHAQAKETEIRADVFQLGDEIWVNGDIYSENVPLYSTELVIQLTDPEGGSSNRTVVTKTIGERSGTQARKKVGFEMPILQLDEAMNGTWTVLIEFTGNEEYEPTSIESQITLPISSSDTFTEPDTSAPEEDTPEPSKENSIPSLPWAALLTSIPILFMVISKRKSYI